MGLINVITNEVKAAVGYQQSFSELLASKDVTRALSMMNNRAEKAAEHLLEYEISSHKIMERKDRAVYDKTATSYAGERETNSLSPGRNTLTRLRLCSSMADL